MIRLLFLCSSLLSANALAHPGHGNPAVLHTHTAAELLLADIWIVIVLAGIVAGVCWGLVALWKRLATKRMQALANSLFEAQ